MENTAKIIVVDDEKRICHNVEKILSKNNYEIVHALSAQDALEKMAKETFSLLISDIVMPGMNGLELLKMVKKQWPLTKALMMTAYASTDTAVKTIRLGALDYIPKPFTPDELRNKVGMALAGELREVTSTDAEREVIDVIDMDMPFETDEVAKYTGDDYAKMLTRSDMPIVEVPKSVPTETPEHFCKTGNMVCDMFKKLEGTCKGGLKTSKCPKLKAQKRKAAAAKAKGADPRTLVGIDMPFSYEEVVSVTGPEYVANLHHEGVSFLPYEQLKQRVEKMKHQIIDVDSPFDADEVAKQTGEAYAKSLGPSDMPVVEAPAAAETLEHFCEMGSMVCDIFKKMGGTCKAGIKKSECPKVRARMKKAAAQKAVFDSNRLISVDQPFDYEEVVAVTGAEYVANLHHDGMSVLPYEELKQNVSQMLEREAAQEALAAAADYPGLPKEPVQRNILVIDDEVAVNNNVRKILVKKGFHVNQAVTRDEAIHKLDTRTYKLVLLDLKIPGVKGLEMLEAIRDKNPEAKVIIITGYASIDTAVDSARMGAIGYIPKPFTPTEIRTATESAFRIAA